MCLKFLNIFEVDSTDEVFFIVILGLLRCIARIVFGILVAGATSIAMSSISDCCRRCKEPAVVLTSVPKVKESVALKVAVLQVSY